MLLHPCWAPGPAITRRPSPRQPRNVISAATTRKIGNNPQKSSVIELNLERLCSGASDLPARQIGPVEVANGLPAGRGVVAKDNLGPGSLLFVSEPVGPVMTAPAGQQLAPAHLLQHWQSAKPGLTAADRFKLSLLHSSSKAAPCPPAISFKDFSSSKAATKAKKATAKGFGGPAATAQQQQPPAGMSEQQLADIVNENAFGEDRLDGALTRLRQEQQQSIIGVWPEFALLNHSCAPNTVPPVVLSDRLLVRAAVAVPKGEQLTTSYLSLAGGIPAPARQALLQQHYGFTCSCHRCAAEAKAPPAVQAALQEMHEWSRSQPDVPQLLLLMQQGDTAALTDLHTQASQLVAQLEQALKQVQEPVVVQWLRASAYDTYALALRTGDFLAGIRATDAAQQLADLVRVFAPASEPHLLLLSDSAIRASEAAAAGSSPSSPEDTPELRVQRLVRAVCMRYGEPKELELLSRLTGAVTASLSPNWLGLVDVAGTMGLQQLMDAAAAFARADAGSGSDGGKQKAEISAQQLAGLVPTGTADNASA